MPDPRDKNREDKGKPGGPRRPESGRGKGVDFRGGRLLILLLIGIVFFIMIQFGTKTFRARDEEKIDYGVFEKRLVGADEEYPNARIATVIVDGQVYKGKYHPGHKYTYYVCNGPPLDSDLRNKIVSSVAKVKIKPPSRWSGILLNFALWFVLLGLAWWLLFRRVAAGGGPGGVLSFGKSRATLVTKEKTRKTFADVAGIDEAKEEVQEIIDFLKNPGRFQRMGARIPKGALLIGEPGTGKTLLAKAIAGEADVPFYSISGSDFVEMFVGVGASRVRDLFQQAKETSPCIIFLDEIDAVGRRRGTGLGGGHDEREQTLNAILVEMDGFDSNEKVIVMAATNRPDVLDPALLRPGRFDRRIIVDLPDVRGREAIFRVHGKRVRLADDVNFARLAKATPSFSGADLENLINEAALQAVQGDKTAVAMEDCEEARDKVLWGRERKSRVLDEEDRHVTAYHEGGHALLAHLLPEVDPLHKVTIIPRGMALGATMNLPRKDEYNKTRKKLMGELTVLFGGRTAEEMFCKDISTGAKSDIDRASAIARKMVCEWGMSDKLGLLNYSSEEEHLFLGHEIARQRHHSEATAVVIDAEVRRIVDEAQTRARKILGEHKKDVGCVAESLLEYEVLSAEDIERLLGGLQIEREPARSRQAGPEGAQETGRAS